MSRQSFRQTVQETDGRVLQLPLQAITRMIVGEFKVIPFSVGADGRVDLAWTPNKELMKGYMQKLAHAIPGAVAKETAKYWTMQKDGRRAYVWDVLDHQDGARAALEELNRTLRQLSRVT